MGEGPSLRVPCAVQNAKDACGMGKIDAIEALAKEREWDIMTGEIDKCLHEFRHRMEKRLPRFYVRGTVDAPNITEAIKEGNKVVAYRFGSELEKAFIRLPDIPVEESGMSLPGHVEPTINDSVTVHLLGRSVKGKVLKVEPKMSAALLSYEEFPAVFDEYQPYDRLRVPISGETGVEVKDEDVKPGRVVVSKSGSVREVSRKPGTSCRALSACVT